MTRLAVYEQGEGKEDIRLSKYYKADYVRYQILKSVVCMTVAYVVILALLVLYNIEYLLANAVTMNYASLITYIVAVYVLLLAVYVLGSLLLYSIRFDQSRKRLVKFYRHLKELRAMYDSEEKLEGQRGENV